MPEYQVVTAERIADVQDRVNELMGKGYRPIGGIAMLHLEQAGLDKLHVVFAQAVLRDPGPPPA